MNCFDGPTCIKRTSSRSDSERKCSSTGTRRHRRSSRIPDGERDHGDRVARRSTAPSRSLPDSPTWGSGANTSAIHLWRPASSQSAGSRSISSFTVRLRTALKFSESFMAQGTFTLCSWMMLSLSTPPKYEMAHYFIGLLRKGPNWTASSTEETQRIQAGTSTSSLLLGFPRVRGPPMGAAQGCSPRVQPWGPPRGPPHHWPATVSSVLSEKSESEGGRSILPLLCRAPGTDLPLEVQ